MHTLLFSLKRSDQASRAFQRRLLHPFDITPARYDLLFVVLQHIAHKRLPDIWQSHLRKLLGVTPPTVCRMAKALERLGFLIRTRQMYNDRRQVRISLTKKAMNLLRAIRKRVIRRGMIWLVIEQAMKGEGNMGDLEVALKLFREGMRDPADFHFPDQYQRIPGSW